MKGLTVREHLVLYKDAQYNTFPSAIHLNDGGGYLVGFRQAPDRRSVYGRYDHIDPSSRAVTISSADGRNWSKEAEVLFDHFLYGVQDPCLNVMFDGTIVGTFFMWKVFETGDLPEQPRDRAVYDQWRARKAGAYTIRSNDGGKTWDQPVAISIPDVAIRGTGVQAKDGSLLIPMYRLGSDGFEVLIARTEDCGHTWTIQGTVRSIDGCDFQEPLLYRAPSGKLVVLMRTRLQGSRPEANRCPLYTSESTDDGVTWSRPAAQPFYSPSPFHGLLLKDGRLLLTYGHRYEPYGIRAALLDPECERWDASEEIVLREDASGRDIGYTSSVQLDDRTVLVTYYYYDPDGYRYIAGTLCELHV